MFIYFLIINQGYFIIDFMERRSGEWRERERNINVQNINQLSPVPTLTGDRTDNLRICPDCELNPQPCSACDDAPTK